MTSWEWAEVRCRRCGAPYRRHEPGGGPLRANECEGFQWVDPIPDVVTRARDQAHRSS